MAAPPHAVPSNLARAQQQLVGALYALQLSAAEGEAPRKGDPGWERERGRLYLESRVELWANTVKNLEHAAAEERTWARRLQEAAEREERARALKLEQQLQKQILTLEPESALAPEPELEPELELREDAKPPAAADEEKTPAAPFFRRSSPPGSRRALQGAPRISGATGEPVSRRVDRPHIPRWTPSTRGAPRHSPHRVLVSTNREPSHLFRGAL